MQKLILLIDDDRDEFFILNQAMQLAELSHVCMWADSSDRAEHLLQHMLPDVILIDYNMPKLNGIECLKKIRTMNKLEKVPVMIYSNQITDETKQKAAASGAVCLEKGSIDQMVHKLVDLINDKDIRMVS